VDTASNVGGVPSAKPAARGLLAGEVLDRYAAVTACDRRDGLPRGLANDGNPGNAHGIAPAPQSLGIEPAFMVRAGVALEPNQDVDSADARNRRPYELDELTLIGPSDRSGNRYRNETTRIA
jgi:hypothetical protein